MTQYNGYEVYPARLRRRASGFVDCGETLDRVLDGLNETVAAEGEPWGGDRYGVEFLRTHDPLRKSIERGFADNAAAMYDIKKSLDEMAGRYEDAERDNTLRA